MLREYTFPAHTPKFTILADRRVFPPRGLFGGGDGRTARYSLVSTGEPQDLASKCTFVVPQGAVVRYETCGGGGYGDPLQRDPALVARDVRDGKVGIGRAAEAYGVVVDPATWQVDAGETQRLRAGGGVAP